MSNKKITELSNLKLAEIQRNDLLPIADVSVPETKNVTIEDVASWVAYSASAVGVAFAQSASYSDTASFLLLVGNRINGTASWAISCSWATFAYSASHVVSSSYSVTSSYARTCSYFDGTISGAFSVAGADTASFLLYQGWPNGTSSHAIYAANAGSVLTASYLNLGLNNGQVATASIASNAISSSYATTASFWIGTGNLSGTSSWATSASFLVWNAAYKNSASWAQTAAIAIEASSSKTLSNSRIFREWGPNTSSIFGSDTIASTASFGYFQVTGSGVKIIVEAWGDVSIPQSGSINYSGSIRLALSQSSTAFFALDEARFQNFVTGSDPTTFSQMSTGSVICRFYLKGYTTTADATQRYLVEAYANNGISFVTGSETLSSGPRGVRCVFKANSDNVLSEQDPTI